MKKRIISSLLTLLLVASLIMPVSVQADTIELSDTKVKLYVGETYQLDIYGEAKKVSWSSTDKSIVKVNKKGVITGVKNGKTKVNAKIGKTTYSCTVTVKDKVKYDIEINGKTIKLTYSSNFGFSSIQPIVTYYDKKGKILGTTEFTNSKLIYVGVDMIEEKELPKFDFSYYEITFATE